MKKYFSLIFAVLISVVIFVFRDSFIHFQNFGLFGLFLLGIIGNATIILPVPVVLTAFIGGSIFNPAMVTLIVAFGATIGEMTGYLAGVSGRETVEKNKKIQKVKVWMDKYGLWTIFILSAIPNPLFDLAGIIAGAYKILVYKYFAVVFLGKIIKFGLLAYIGNYVLH